MTPLEVACYKADVDAVRERLAAGAPVTFDALRNAVNFGTKGQVKKRVEILRLLLDAGGDPNTPVGVGASIMWVSAGSVSPEMLRMLIAAGGRVNGGELLHSAVSGNQPDNIRVLLAAGADPNETQKADGSTPNGPTAGMTPLQYARHLKHTKCVAALTEGPPAGKPGA